MKRIALFFCFILSFAAHANNIIVNGTRFIYPGNEKEITVQLSNTADRPRWRKPGWTTVMPTRRRYHYDAIYYHAAYFPRRCEKRSDSAY